VFAFALDKAHQGQSGEYSSSNKSLAKCRQAKKIELHLQTAPGSLRIMSERKTDLSTTIVLEGS